MSHFGRDVICDVEQEFVQLEGGDWVPIDRKIDSGVKPMYEKWKVNREVVTAISPTKKLLEIAELYAEFCTELSACDTIAKEDIAYENFLYDLADVMEPLLEEA